MSSNSFVDKLAEAQQATRSDILLLIAPRLSQLPLPVIRYDDPFLPFARAIINATRDLVCGYMFDLGAYLALGAAGAIALERTLPLVDEKLIKVLHGPFAGPNYAAAAFESAFACDAVTLVDDVYMEHYLTEPRRGAFVVQRGLPRTDHVHGIYWTDFRFLTTPVNDEKVLSMNLADEKVLFAGHGDDFAEQVQQALKRMRDD